LPHRPVHHRTVHIPPKVTALARQADKAKEAKALHADLFLTTDEALAAKKGYFDIVLNTASGAVDDAAAVGMLRGDGVYIQVGVGGGDVWGSWVWGMS
jgi:D-arabinose 1-dehydrogenase-like Zn-dependent alcohol dehydrogenase